MNNKIHYFIFAATVLCAGEHDKDEITIAMKDLEKIKSLKDLHALIEKDPGTILNSDHLDLDVVCDYLEAHGKKVTWLDDKDKERALIKKALQSKKSLSEHQINTIMNLIIQEKKIELTREKESTEAPIDSNEAISNPSEESNESLIAVLESVLSIVNEHLGQENELLGHKYAKKKKQNKRQRYISLALSIAAIALPILSGYLGNQMNTCPS